MMRSNILSRRFARRRTAFAGSTPTCGVTSRAISPYALLYLDEPEQVWIIAVMPLRRDPDYWTHRLTNGVLLFVAVLAPPQQRQIAKDIGLTVEESPER